MLYCRNADSTQRCGQTLWLSKVVLVEAPEMTKACCCYCYKTTSAAAAAAAAAATTAAAAATAADLPPALTHYLFMLTPACILACLRAGMLACRSAGVGGESERKAVLHLRRSGMD